MPPLARSSSHADGCDNPVAVLASIREQRRHSLARYAVALVVGGCGASLVVVVLILFGVAELAR